MISLGDLYPRVWADVVTHSIVRCGIENGISIQINLSWNSSPDPNYISDSGSLSLGFLTCQVGVWSVILQGPWENSESLHL